MFQYLFIALIYVPESSTLDIRERVATLKECQEIGKQYKAMEDNVDYRCVKLQVEINPN